jgi:hypothetical protein
MPDIFIVEIQHQFFLIHCVTLDQYFSTAGPWHQLYWALVLSKTEFTGPQSDNS